jgi:hypothetical protein
METARKPALDRQSCQGVNAQASVSCPIARFSGSQSDLSHTRLGWRGVASLRSLAGLGCHRRSRRHEGWVVLG